MECPKCNLDGMEFKCEINHILWDVFKSGKECTRYYLFTGQVLECKSCHSKFLKQISKEEIELWP